MFEDLYDEYNEGEPLDKRDRYEKKADEIVQKRAEQIAKENGHFFIRWSEWAKTEAETAGEVRPLRMKHERAMRRRKKRTGCLIIILILIILAFLSSRA